MGLECWKLGGGRGQRAERRASRPGGHGSGPVRWACLRCPSARVRSHRAPDALPSRSHRAPGARALCVRADAARVGGGWVAGGGGERGCLRVGRRLLGALRPGHAREPEGESQTVPQIWIAAARRRFRGKSARARAAFASRGAFPALPALGTMMRCASSLARAPSLARARGQWLRHTPPVRPGEGTFDLVMRSEAPA